MEKIGKYRIGLDLGISSVGWAVLEHDQEDNPRRIVDLGVRVFDAAENAKDGSSLAVERRLNRGLRRRLRRKANRIRKTNEYLSYEFFGESDFLVDNKEDVYKLRHKALFEKLELEELYAVIVYLVKHRGFKSNRKSETNEKDMGLLLKSLELNAENAQKYQTLGEWIYSDNKFWIEKSTDRGIIREYKVRNHNGSYENCFKRSDLDNELKIILDKQKCYYPNIITEQFEQIILSLFNEQRSFDDGPNEPSPYKSNFAVGNCTLEKNEYRAPKGSFTFEYFTALNKLNNLTILDKDKQIREITLDEKQIIISKLFAGEDITFSKIRKVLGIDSDFRFKNLTYKYLKPENKSEKPTEIDIKGSEKSSYIKFDKVKLISQAINREISAEFKELYDAIAFILAMRKSDSKRRDAFCLNDEIVNNLTEQQRNALKALTADEIEKLLYIDITKFGNLSIKAMSKIIPYLEQGLVYDKACECAGYDFRNISNAERKTKLCYEDIKEELADITSPVVKRTISQTIKVINAIIDRYGSPSAIFIEMARELALNRKDRDDIKRKQEIRKSENERIEKKLREEFNIIPTGQDIVRYRLYEEQGGKCAYSTKSFEEVLGSVKAIFENNNTQIDHIIPYSKCFDDSYSNKVLVLSDENQKKGNRLPVEYMDKEQFARFEEFVQNQYKGNLKKQTNLLHKPLSEEQIKELNSRALNDTRYSVKLIKQILERHLLFASSKFDKMPVRCVNGGITSYLRKIWGLTKNRIESDKHHAQDAVVIATATSGMINNITKYFQYKSYLRRKGAYKIEKSGNTENIVIIETGEVISREEYDRLYGPEIVKPYELFCKELEARLFSINPRNKSNEDIYLSIGYSDNEIEKVKPVFISRMPTRKVLGKIHKETIRSAPYTKDNDKKYVATKTKLIDLKLDKNGEILGYPDKAKKDDKLLYNALKNRLLEFDGDAKRAFAEEFYKPKSDGTQGNPVHSVKIEKVVTDGVMVNNGFADKGRMVRTDIFARDNKYYAVPIYVNDVYSGILPNLAVVAGKPQSKWLNVLDKENPFEFKFSLYPNDLVYIEKETPLTATNSSGKKIDVHKDYLYYNGLDIATGALSFINHDKSLLLRGVGIQKLKVFRKCEVDILGNISFVNQKSRQSFNIKK